MRAVAKSLNEARREASERTAASIAPAGTTASSTEKTRPVRRLVHERALRGRAAAGRGIFRLSGALQSMVANRPGLPRLVVPALPRVHDRAAACSAHRFSRRPWASPQRKPPLAAASNETEPELFVKGCPASPRTEASLGERRTSRAPFHLWSADTWRRRFPPA
jgi:hypothetical protein